MKSNQSKHDQEKRTGATRGTEQGQGRCFESRVVSSIYMKFRKMVMMVMTLHVRQQKRHRYKEQTLGLCGRRQGWDDLRE